MEYVLLIEYTKWCEDNSDIEWMGYYNTADDRVSRFLKWKYSKKNNE